MDRGPSEVMSVDRKNLEIFKTLFKGREDAYGIEGNKGPLTIRKPVTDSIFLDHLEGKVRIGIFPLLPGGKIKWAVIDFDKEDRQSIERIFVFCVEARLFPYLERSKTRGFHVWLFFDDPVSAKDARKFLQGVLEKAGVPGCEVFPKQDSTRNNGLGNYVFLPQHGESIKQGRTVFLNTQFEPYPDQWDQLKRIHFTKSENIPPASETNPQPNEGVLDLQKYLDHYGVKFKVKEEQDRTFYLLDRCLFSENHTTKDGQGEAAIIQGRDGKLTYFCFHAHCSGKTWQEARKSISGNDSIIQFRKGYTPPVEKGNLTLDSAILDSNDFVCLEIPAKRNFIKPWLKDNHIILISGNRGVGKSWFGLSAFDHVTQKKKFGIWEAETSVPSLYIDGEMAAFDVQDRLKLLNPTIPSRQSPLYIYSDAFANGLGMPRANLLNDGWREAVKQFALSKNVKLIGFDNISSLAPGIDENVKFEWGPINQWLLNLRFLGISTILFHHTNKEGGQRGTSAREDNIDTSIILQRPPDYHAEEGAKFIVKFQKARVGLSDLSLLADIEFTLTQNGSGLIWTYGSVKRKTQVEILKMIDEGISQSEIGRILGVDRSYVSRTKTKAIKDNLLTPKGKLTQSGFSMVNSGENEDEI